MTGEDEFWRQKLDEELLEASEDLSEYTEEGEQIIRAELRRRGLPEPAPPVGVCPACGRSINQNHPSERCAICEALLPPEILERLDLERGRAGGERSVAEAGSRPCPDCGSAKWIPDVPLIDRTSEYGKGAAELQLDICGDCGHAELRVSNFRDLYDAYVQSQTTADDRPVQPAPAEPQPEEEPRLVPGDAVSFCYHCGADVVPGATRCSACGKPL